MEEAVPAKPRYLAPNLREYYFDSNFSCIRRIDLRGAGTRHEQRIAKRKARNERKRALKRKDR